MGWSVETNGSKYMIGIFNKTSQNYKSFEITSISTSERHEIVVIISLAKDPGII